MCALLRSSGIDAVVCIGLVADILNAPPMLGVLCKAGFEVSAVSSLCTFSNPFDVNLYSKMGVTMVMDPAEYDDDDHEINQEDHDDHEGEKEVTETPKEEVKETEAIEEYGAAITGETAENEQPIKAEASAGKKEVTETPKAEVEVKETEAMEEQGSVLSEEPEPQEFQVEQRSDVLEQIFEKRKDPEAPAPMTSYQVRRLAQLLGFNCEDEEWEIEFTEVCSDRKWDPSQGLDQQQLTALLSDTHFSPGYVEQPVLKRVAQELLYIQQAPERRPHVVNRVWHPHAKTEEEQQKKPRQVLIKDLFEALDTKDKHAKYLGCEELKDYARLCGFLGTDVEWTVEWAELCADLQWDAEHGATLPQFTKLVDRLQAGDYSGNAELRMLIASKKQGLEIAPAALSSTWQLKERTQKKRMELPKKDLVKILFCTLDSTQNGTLGPDQLRKYAEMIGWEGDDEAWAQEYAGLCYEYGVTPQRGFTHTQFSKVLEDQAGDADGEELAAQIELAAAPEIMLPKKASSRRLIKKRTWRSSPSRLLLRKFGILLREKFATPDEAYDHFAGNQFTRLKKEEFLKKLEGLNFDDDGDELWKVVALGNSVIVKKQFRFSWNLQKVLLDGEELVRTIQRQATRDRLMSEASQASLAELVDAHQPKAEREDDKQPLLQGPGASRDFVA